MTNRTGKGRIRRDNSQAAQRHNKVIQAIAQQERERQRQFDQQLLEAYAAGKRIAPQRKDEPE